MANMLIKISSPKDFWAGLIYIAIGAAAIWIGSAYRFGVAGRMGPGYFPFVLASGLVAVGVVSFVRSFVVPGGGIGKIAWKPLFVILLANLLFGFLLPRAGLVVALIALTLVSAAASREFRFEWRASLGLGVLVLFCALVFVKGLGVPMPIVGSWLEPYVPASWLF